MRTYKDLIRAAQELASTEQDITDREFRKRAAMLMVEAERYGVGPEINSILNKRKKQASAPKPPGDYTNLPLRNPTEIKKAAEWFAQFRSRFPFEVRVKQARQILERAEALGVSLEADIEECLHKSACLGLINKNFIKHELTKRAEYFEQSGRQNLAENINSIIKELDGFESDDALLKNGFAVKLAGYVDALDRRYNLLTKYGKSFQIPEDFIFSQSIEPIIEYASLIGNVKTGKYYSPKDLERLDMQKLKDALGPEFEKAASVAGAATDAAGLKEWFKTATKDEARIFDVLAAEQGIYPTAEKLPEE